MRKRQNDANTMTGAIEGRHKAKVSNSKQVLLTLLYSLQTQNRSLFLAEVMKTTNNEGFNIQIHHR